jgi:hypothetical protein
MRLPCFAPQETLLTGINDIIERRWGKKIAIKGIDRDRVRSSDSHFVKISGLRWLSVMMLVKIPWAKKLGNCLFLPLYILPRLYQGQCL